MRSHIASWFGVAGSTIATLAVAASVWATTLPYRLSPPQSALLDVAFFVQMAGVVFGAGFGIAAFRGDARSRRLGFVTLVLTVVTFGFIFFGSYIHSTSAW
jgi:hypothetical protein